MVNFTKNDNTNKYIIDVMKTILFSCQTCLPHLIFPKSFSPRTHSILMHSNYIIFKMLLLDLFTHFPNTTLHYGTKVWKTFINKESDFKLVEIRQSSNVLSIYSQNDFATAIATFFIPRPYQSLFFSVLLLCHLFSLMCCFAN